jgi:hypothetical protein
MSARQRVLRHHAVANQLVPLDSARVPLFGPITDCLWGRDRRSQVVAANLPNDAFTITTNCGRNRRQNRLANALFWLDLTIFRMNTCAKRVGVGGVESWLLLQLSSVLGAAPFGFKGAVFPRPDPGLACNCTPDAIALQCGSRFG